MRTPVLFLLLLVVTLPAPQLLRAQSLATTTSVAVRTYNEGYSDGTAQAAAYASRYGYGTADYENAIVAAETRADNNSKNSSDSSYWHGYRDALQDY